MLINNSMVIGISLLIPIAMIVGCVIYRVLDALTEEKTHEKALNDMDINGGDKYTTLRRHHAT